MKRFYKYYSIVIGLQVISLFLARVDWYEGLFLWSLGITSILRMTLLAGLPKLIQDITITHKRLWGVFWISQSVWLISYFYAGWTFEQLDLKIFSLFSGVNFKAVGLNLLPFGLMVLRISCKFLWYQKFVDNMNLIQVLTNLLNL